MRFVNASRGLLMALLLLLVMPTVAHGWANGGDDRNGYGSHDWILDQAIRLSGTSGTWVNRTVALRATDDADSNSGWRAYQSYKPAGNMRGGPYMVAQQYHLMVAAHDRKDYRAASIYLGNLSHYYSDICQPYHDTFAGASARNKSHEKYEYAVSAYQRKPNSSPSWIAKRERRPMADARASAVSAALFSRSRYVALDKSYKKTRKIDGTTKRITRQVMSRAVNDLADLVRSVPEGSAEATAPTTPTMNLNTNYPRPGQRVRASVICKDAMGRPLPGVGVQILWRLPTGDRTVTVFTQDDGEAYWNQDIGSPTLDQQSIVSASIPVAGRTIRLSQWYMPYGAYGEYQ